MIQKLADLAETVEALKGWVDSGSGVSLDRAARVTVLCLEQSWKVEPQTELNREMKETVKAGFF